MGKARIKCERIDQKMNKEMTSKFFEALTDLEKENNIHANPANEVIVTVGGEEAMSVAVLSLIDAGDEVLTQFQESSI